MDTSFTEGTGGKYPHAGVAAKAGRLYGWTPALAFHHGKAPYEPQVGVALDAPKGVGVPVFRLKYHGGKLSAPQAALPGYAEFLRKVALYAGYDL